MADMAHLSIPGEGETRSNRIAGLGPLMGIATGVGVAAAYGAVTARAGSPGLLRGGVLTALAAMVGANGPMTLLGITDPRTWDAASWASDVVPHLAYGLVTAATYDALTDPRPVGRHQCCVWA